MRPAGHLATVAIVALMTGLCTSITTTAPPAAEPEPSQDCEQEIAACNTEFGTLTQSATSLPEICSGLEELVYCFLQAKSCEQRFIRDELIPRTYSATRNQGLACDPPALPTESPHHPTHPAAGNGTHSHGGDGCGDDINACVTEYTGKVGTASTSEDHCRLLEDLSNCYRKSTQCDMDLIEKQIIPETYGQARERGLFCDNDPCGEEVNECLRWYNGEMGGASTTEDHCRLLEDLTKCFQKTTRCDKDLIQNQLIANTYAEAQRQGLYCDVPTTVDKTTAKPYESCSKQFEQCRQNFEWNFPYTPTSEVCSLLYDYQSCMWNTYPCDYDLISEQIEDFAGSGLRDCESDDSGFGDGASSLRITVWSAPLVIAVVSCLVQALSN